MERICSIIEVETEKVLKPFSVSNQTNRLIFIMAKAIIKSFKFSLKPSKAQVTKLENTLNLCRELYNSALRERKDAWAINRISINRFDQDKQLPAIKQTNPEYKEIHSQVWQDVL